MRRGFKLRKARTWVQSNFRVGGHTFATLASVKAGFGNLTFTPRAESKRRMEPFPTGLVPTRPSSPRLLRPSMDSAVCWEFSIRANRTLRQRIFQMPRPREPIVRCEGSGARAGHP
jgi:hypothetical protein